MMLKMLSGGLEAVINTSVKRFDTTVNTTEPVARDSALACCRCSPFNKS